MPLLADLSRFTDHTITDPLRLFDEFAQIRRRGYAVNRGEWQHDVYGLAAPIFVGTSRTVVGSIGLSGPANRFGQEATRRFIPMVRAAAAAISQELQSPPAAAR
jgi:DNA-binding IclR family transcriptional regulator